MLRLSPRVEQDGAAVSADAQGVSSTGVSARRERFQGIQRFGRSGIHEDAAMPASTPSPDSWTTTERVCTHLGIGARTLRALMADTPAHAERPWVNISGGSRPTYRWRLADVDGWVREVEGARSPTATTGRPPAPARRRSTTATPATTGSNLKLLADELTKRRG